MAHRLFSPSYLSYKFRRVRFLLLISATLVGLFYYSFLNEEYSINQLLDEETLPRITNENADHFAHQGPGNEKSGVEILSDQNAKEDLTATDTLKEKNKYFPILENEPANAREEGAVLPNDYFKNQKGTNLRKHKKKWLYPVGKENLIQFPKISKKEDYPGVQSTYFNDGGLKDQAKLDQIKEAFKTSWANYKKHGYGHDEVRPISHKASDPFNGWSATLVDGLDTLWIIDEKREFEGAVQFINTVNFKQSFRKDIPIFENVIRILGGLLGAYDLSNEEILLNSAVEFADFLIEAFDTPNHMPLLYYRWQDEMPNRLASRDACLAEVGSLSLEFSRISQLTGDNKYYDAIARITEFFTNSIDNFFMKGLVPNKIDISGCKLLTKEEIDEGVHLHNPKVIKAVYEGSYVYCLIRPEFVTRQITQRYSLGGLADSYYEYMPKMYHLLRGDEKHAKVYKDQYLAALDDIKTYMLFKPKIPGGENVLFASSIGVSMKEDKILVEQELDMQHLTCFAGGMFGLGSRLFNRPDDMDIAEKLTMGCVSLYEKLDIMPEIIHVNKMKSKEDLYDEEKRLDKIGFIQKSNSQTGGYRDLTLREAENVKQKILEKSGMTKSKRDAGVIVDPSKDEDGLHKPDPLYQILLPRPEQYPPIEVLENDNSVWTVDKTHNQPTWVNSMEPKYILRPEAIESVFYMYRLTGESKWRDYGWKMFENILKHCKTSDGEFAALKDITVKGERPDNFEDSLESFWFSETLKYFYLLFDDIKVLSLDEYVLNTEAHAFKLVD